MTGYNDNEFDDNQTQQENTGNGLRSALEAAKKEAAQFQKELAGLRRELAIERHHLNEKQVSLMEKSGLAPDDFVKEYGDLFAPAEASQEETNSTTQEAQAPNAQQNAAALSAEAQKIADGFNRIVNAQEAGSPVINGAFDPAEQQIAQILAEGGGSQGVHAFLKTLPGYTGA